MKAVIRYKAKYFDDSGRHIGTALFDAGLEEEGWAYAYVYKSINTLTIELYMMEEDGSFSFLSDWRIHDSR